MKSTDKLRWYIRAFVTGGMETDLTDLADEIEQKIAERYMELPVDADGVPIHAGDCLQLGDTRGEVVALTYCSANGKLPWEWQCDTGDWYNTAFAYHVKPHTIEDVLREFASQQHGITTEENDALITKYADELRNMGVGE